MKIRLLSSLFCGMFALMLHAQADVRVLADVTSKIANADFTADTPITELICTYDYDMANNGTTRFGQQAVMSWTATTPSDNIAVERDTRTDNANAKAGGVYAYLDADETGGPGLGSAQYHAPYKDANYAGQGLGVVAVWGADIQYTQNITLSAGGYMMIVTVHNVGDGGNISASLNGFVPAEGSAFVSSKTSFDVGEWQTDTILFRLTAETAGQLSLGYKANGVGSASSPHLFFDHVNLYTIDERYFVQIEIDEAKVELLSLIETGRALDVDVAASQAVYDNPDATLEEVLAAIENQKELNESVIVDLSEYFIVNPKFSQDEDPIQGGVCTYDYDCEKNNISTSNYSLTSVKGWIPNSTENGRAGGVFAIGSNAFLGGADFLPPTAMSDGSTVGNLLGIVTCWSGIAQYRQNVTLPAGKYTVVISYYNVGGAQAVAKNLNGFVVEDGAEYLGEVTTYPVGSWLTETITFELGEETTGYFSLGYQATNTGSGNMPHLFVDGFSLYYVGAGIDASMMALNSAVNQGNQVLDEVFNADLREQLEEAVRAGQELIDAHSSDSDANKEAALAISSLMDAVSASINAYTKLQDFHDTQLLPACDKYDEESYPELSNTLQNMLDEVEDAIQEGSWTTEKIEEVISSLEPIIKEGIQKAWDAAVASGAMLDEDLDISILFDQLAYTYSTTAVSNTNVPDKEWQYGSATNFKTQYGTAEVWNQSPFTVSRTIKNLPAGKYTITTKAFFRMADNATNYADWNPANTPQANLFAGGVKTGLTNVAAIASSELAELEGATTIAEGIYVPNSQRAAYLLFNDEAYTDALQKSVSTVLTSEGDLTFGITADEMLDNSWVVWYTFSIAYNAPDRNALYDVLDALDTETRNLQDEEAVAFNEAAENRINDAQNKNDDRDNMSEEELKSLVTEYEDAIGYARESVALVGELEVTYDLYTNYLMSEVDSDEPTFNDLIGEIEAAFSDGYESNEQIQGFLDGLKNGWTAFVQYPVLTSSSEANPGDITAVIYNAGFVDPVSGENNANGWTSVYDGGNTGGAYETYEYYNNNSFRISQTINGLAEGSYLIRVQSFYRAGDNVSNAATLTENPDSITHAYLFAQTESSNREVAVKNVLERENEDGELGTDIMGVGSEVEVTNYKDYESFYVPNDRESFAAYNMAGIYWNKLEVFVKKGESLTLGLYKDEHVAADWCPFDNFELYYLGPEPLTAVEGVEAETGRKLANGAIYNLAGQRVNKAVKGLYIINGKKVLVR